MGWRPGEVWFDADVPWFRERPQGFGAPAIAGGAIDLPRFDTGLEASRRRRFAAEAARKRRFATRTVPAAALVIGSSVVLPAAGLEAARGGAGWAAAAGGPSEPSVSPRVPDLASRLAAYCTGWPHHRVAPDRVAPGCLERPSLRRTAAGRHPVTARRLRLGHVEPEQRLPPQPAGQAVRQRAHDPDGHRGACSLPGGAPAGSAHRHRGHQPPRRRGHGSARVASERARRERPLSAPRTAAAGAHVDDGRKTCSTASSPPARA